VFRGRDDIGASAGGSHDGAGLGTDLVIALGGEERN
jgi:hypothetical protein